MRLAPTGAVTGSLLNFDVSDDYTTTGGGTSGYTGIAPGTIMQAAPTDGVITTANVPNWGVCELVYVLNTSSTTFLPGKPVTLDKNFAIAELASTANQARPVYVTLTNFSAGNTTTQGGWVLRRGIAPVTFSVAATAGAVYIGTAGNFTPTPAAGKQILNAVTLIAASGSFTRGAVTSTGSSFVRTNSVAGVFVGQAISGTGIPGSSVVSSIDPGGQGVTIGSAVGTPVTATASGAITATFTHTGYGIVHLDCPFAQGQIT